MTLSDPFLIIMDPRISIPQVTRAEKEAETEAGRLTTQIERALAVVGVPTNTDPEELEACADSLERSARNLVALLRELGQERKRQNSDE
jgi:hypothetical protein